MNLGGNDAIMETDREILRVERTGATILNCVANFLGRFVVYPSEHALIAHTLWLAHTHSMGSWESTPRLAFLSPEPGSGKTGALEISALLVPRPVEAVNVTAAYLFRKTADVEGLPTILFDEIDTVFGPRARENEEIRGILNAGHRRGAQAGRCAIVRNAVITEDLPAYCAVAMAGLGDLPDTILTRSVVILMRRRGPREKVEPYRRRDHGLQGEGLREDLASWVAGEATALERARPTMPDGVEDRSADVWEPLLAIADAAGGRWPTAARTAASAFLAQGLEKTPSLGIRLLKDLHNAFGSSQVLSTDMILGALLTLDEAPWGDLRGRPVDARKLAALLRPYSIQSKTIRIGQLTAKGYARDDLCDAWSRYLSPDSGLNKVTSVTTDAAVTL